MNKLFISGLGIGREIGVCDCCNMNYDLLMENTQTLLMADKICVPKNSFYKKDDKEYKVIKLLLDMLDSVNALEKYDLAEMYTNRFKENVLNQTKQDSEVLQQDDSEARIVDVFNDNCEEEIKTTFCSPMVSSINASLLIAQDLNAQCLFNANEEKYLKYRYEKICERLNSKKLSDIYKKVFSVVLPNESIFPAYVKENKCDSCVHDKECNDKYLTQLEKELNKILKIRECDELRQIRKIIDRIIKKKNDILEPVTSEKIVEELKREQREVQKNINLRFPLVKRFANIIAMVSVPIAIGSALSNNNPLLYGPSIVMNGIDQMIDKGMKYYESKNNWVNFIGEPDIIKRPGRRI